MFCFAINPVELSVLFQLTGATWIQCSQVCPNKQRSSKSHMHIVYAFVNRPIKLLRFHLLIYIISNQYKYTHTLEQHEDSSHISMLYYTGGFLGSTPKLEVRMLTTDRTSCN
ncbi:hypothetical protein NPIL_504641 [Nephila pilipes]|uniref:Uncharacterized protein n=1 Tax=Nephila pilipes TaxID=299642 RepID=A0A8X6Q329_NEPPI|nr:hypothetical protein NPIL_504641 [Nephila pilipes]